MKRANIEPKLRRLHQLATKVAEAQSEATSARVEARIARLAARTAKKLFRQAKRRARDAAKEAKLAARQLKDASSKVDGGMLLSPPLVENAHRKQRGAGLLPSFSNAAPRAGKRPLIGKSTRHTLNGKPAASTRISVMRANGGTPDMSEKPPGFSSM
jgi:hypothetical protein